MAEYICVAKDATGKDARVAIEADSVRAAVMLLRKQGMTAISVTTVGRKKAALVVGGRRRRIKLVDVAIFCRQLAVMLEAGLAMVDSVKDVGEQSENLRLREVLLDVAKRMEEGETFSAAIAHHPRVFSNLFVSMARAGEEGGSLAKVLADLATYLEDEVALRRKVKAATTYPAFIAGFFCCAVGAVVFFLIPRFEKIFKGFGAELPLLTRAVMGASRLIIDNVHFIFLALIAVAVGLLLGRRTAKGRYALDEFKLRVPIFGKLFRKVVLARVTSALATLLENGVSMVSSLEIVAAIAGNVVVGDAINRSRQAIIRGSSLAAELKKYQLFPPMLTQMTAAGEQSGRMSTMLRRFAKFMDEEVKTTVAGLTAIIEPLLIVLLGGVVAVVVLAIYLPIFKMAGTMK